MHLGLEIGKKTPVHDWSTVVKSLLQSILGAISMVMLVVHTLFISLFVFSSIIWKVMLPQRLRHKWADPYVIGVANVWLAGILWWLTNVLRIRFDVDNNVKLSMEEWYMVVSNHQSWVDIFALFYVTKGKIPLLKFFIKKELMKVPVVGQAWWAMDYPFMSRHSRAYLAKHPEKADDDLKATKKACEKFSYVPTSIVNFLEGTRFTEVKQQKQKAPYAHLLRPKAGGIAFAIQALGERFSSMIDTTIVYQDRAPTFWDLACGRVGTVTLRLRHIEIPQQFIRMDYQNNRQDKKDFQQWLHELWLEKDALITQMKAGTSSV
ncbi:Phospholipid/glycerol acyltransferase [Reinekea sp. MED297]|uniref:Phospholipid/glycerol acyltransferase n=1 Tax=Reinekea blandensis MED297 TaxID=314283 RepID=A4BI50_9GAMM|nr:Phospholipid/glycerol acyltransferase [Reinekea sp. MED297] [Reinekea blandensis MED297]